MNDADALDDTLDNDAASIQSFDLPFDLPQEDGFEEVDDVDELTGDADEPPTSMLPPHVVHQLLICQRKSPIAEPKDRFINSLWLWACGVRHLDLVGNTIRDYWRFRHVGRLKISCKETRI